jgi:hypothetical protein
MSFQLVLDCPPGASRPDSLLPSILDGTGVSLSGTEPDSKVFGSWTWSIPNDQAAAYKAARKMIEDRVKALYHQGCIRYGEW